jgi:hypothetical protein
LSETLNWWSPWPSSPTLWGSTGIFFKPIWHCFTIFQLSSYLMFPRPPSWPKWGSSIIPLYMFTRVHHFWVQFLSDDPEPPKSYPVRVFMVSFQ